MAEGIHVSNLPENATEKQLKVYFSNPRNGGGHVRQILYPLPHNSAVILFENRKTVRDILQKGHVLREQRLSVRPLPKQIFGLVKVELEKGVSQYIERNSQVVDELQYVGELKVEFCYDKEVYILSGIWYQIEWALHYLDELLDESDLRVKYGGQKEGSIGEKRQDFRQTYEPINDEDERPEPMKHHIKKPNIPMVKQSKNITEKVNAEGNTQFPKKGSVAKREEKQRNAGKIDGKTVRQNLDDRGGKDKGYFDEDLGKHAKDKPRQARGAEYENQLDWSSDENEYKGAHSSQSFKDILSDKVVVFGADTDFSENKPRPRRVAPRRTMGIDVAQTDFGEVALMHTFTLPNDLKVQVAMDDITKQSTDGIINPTDPELSTMSGASRAIVQAGGYPMQREMQQYLDKNGNLGWAEVFHTNAGGTLHRKMSNVIHTAGPLWNEEDSETATHYLVCTYINCFMHADNKLWLQSIATPLISAGAYGFPLDVCIQAFYDALLLFSTHGQTSSHLKDIHLICFDEDTSMAAIVILQSLFDCDTTQAVNAATERYNTRRLKSKFAADDFSTEKSSKTVRDAFETKKESQPKQQKNKNANRPLVGADKDRAPRIKDDEYKATKGGRDVEGADSCSDTKDNKAPKMVMNFHKDSRKKPDVENKDEVKEKVDYYRKYDDDDDDDGLGEMRAHSRSNIRRSLSDPEENEDRKSPSGEVTSSDNKIDPKKSLAGIDRPKFTDDPEEGSDGPDDGEDFDVGIINADKYSKKFEDLVESVNKTTHEELEDGKTDDKYRQNDEIGVKDEQEDFDLKIREEKKANKGRETEDTSDEDLDEIDQTQDKQFLYEEVASSGRPKKNEGSTIDLGNSDPEGDDVLCTKAKPEALHVEDLKEETYDRDKVFDDKNGAEMKDFEENKDDFVIMSKEDAEISAALDKELGIEGIQVSAEDPYCDKKSDEELEEDFLGELE